MTISKHLVRTLYGTLLGWQEVLLYGFQSLRPSWDKTISKST